MCPVCSDYTNPLTAQSSNQKLLSLPPWLPSNLPPLIRIQFLFLFITLLQCYRLCCQPSPAPNKKSRIWPFVWGLGEYVLWCRNQTCRTRKPLAMNVLSYAQQVEFVWICYSQSFHFQLRSFVNQGHNSLPICKAQLSAGTLLLLQMQNFQLWHICGNLLCRSARRFLPHIPMSRTNMILWLSRGKPRNYLYPQIYSVQGWQWWNK